MHLKLSWMSVSLRWKARWDSSINSRASPVPCLSYQGAGSLQEVSAPREGEVDAGARYADRSEHTHSNGQTLSILALNQYNIWNLRLNDNKQTFINQQFNHLSVEGNPIQRSSAIDGSEARHSLPRDGISMLEFIDDCCIFLI